MKSKIFLVLAASLGLSLGLSRCAAYPELSAEQPEAEKTEEEKPKAETLHESAYISAEVKPQAQLHNYVVELKWNEGLRSVSGLVLRKFNEKGILLQTFPLQNTGSRYVDVSARENQSLRYELWDSSRLIDQVEIHVPLDLDLSARDHVLQADSTRVGRIVLGRDRKIVANGHSINWKLFSLKAAPGSMIASFETVNTSGPGLPSGELQLDIQKYEGDLFVYWGGQAGAVGQRGADAGGRGPKGGQGHHCKYRPPFTTGGPDGRDFTPGRCERHPGNGGQGGQGPRGGVGHGGHKGGDLQNVSIKVREVVGERLPRIEVAPGAGGLGGPGGNGGRGGEGGDPGHSEGSCSKASRGPEGPQGAPGAQGPRGPGGAWGEIFCFQVEGLTLQGKCEKL